MFNNENKEIGQLRSAGFSPRFKKIVGIAMVEKGFWETSQKFKINIGFSDHSKGKEAALGSVIMGASIIEKHLTLNNLTEGPDHKASTEPEEFREMVKSVRNLEKMLIGKKKNRDYLNKKFVL